jgi:hypothetical protein
VEVVVLVPEEVSEVAVVVASAVGRELEVELVVASEEEVALEEVVEVG